MINSLVLSFGNPIPLTTSIPSLMPSSTPKFGSSISSIMPTTISFVQSPNPTLDPSLKPFVSKFPIVIPSSTSPSLVPSSVPSSISLTSFTFIGCYADTSLVRAMTNEVSIVSSIHECYSIAAAKFYRYFALQNGNQCWANNNFTSATQFGKCDVSGVVSHGQLKYCHCNIPCTASGTGYCGGGWANQVYAITPQYSNNIITSSLATSSILDSISPNVPNLFANTICTYTEVEATANCPENEKSCKVTIASNCFISETMIITDIMMCLFFFLFVIVDFIAQTQIASKIDIKSHTIEDYSVVVNDPNDDANRWNEINQDYNSNKGHISSKEDIRLWNKHHNTKPDDPNSWCKFFGKFGSGHGDEPIVRYITVTRRNKHIFKILYEIKSLKEKLKCFTDSSETKENKSVIIADSANSFFATAADLYQGNSSTCKLQVLVCMFSFFQMEMGLFLKPSTEKDINHRLRRLEADLLNRCDDECPVDRVYVTFEKERWQKLALKSLDVPYWISVLNVKCDACYNQTKRIFRDTNVVYVTQSEDPDAILWSNTQVQNLNKYAYFALNVPIIVAILTGCYFAIEKVQNYGIFKTGGGTPILLTIFDISLPFIFRCITNLEYKDSETIRQKVIHRRLFYSKLLVLIVFPYVITSWDEFLTSAKHNEIRNTQFFTLLVTPLFYLCDISGFVKRHILGHILFSDNQDNYNEMWSGQEWSLAERYVEAAKTVCIILSYSFILPESLLIGILAFIVQYLVDRFCLMKRWKKQARLGKSICQVFPKEVLLAITFHMYATR